MIEATKIVHMEFFLEPLKFPNQVENNCRRKCTEIASVFFLVIWILFTFTVILFIKKYARSVMPIDLYAQSHTILEVERNSRCNFLYN